MSRDVDLLDDARLERSTVVANNAMNRLRGLTGPNSYARELGFEPLAALDEAGSAWLDLCCGSGRALIEAARERPAARLVGIDLVDFFDGHDAGVTLIGVRPSIPRRR